MFDESKSILTKQRYLILGYYMMLCYTLLWTHTAEFGQCSGWVFGNQLYITQRWTSCICLQPD